MGVFKAYDIRGIFPSELNEDFAYALGRALVVFLDAKTLIVGRDVRLSSLRLHRRFVEGITDQGCDVQDIGVCSTNMIYFAARKGDAAMITASHTPKDYNGFKLCRKGAVPIGQDSGLRDLEALVAANTFKRQKKGEVKTVNILAPFVEDVIEYGKNVKPLKIVVDAGNGCAGIAVGKILEKLDVEMIPLFFEQDGSFPGRGPNPLLDGATDALQKKVIASKADFGVAYDADCDRVFFVDEKGVTVQADLITALIAEELLKQQPGATILYDLRSSWAVKERITQLGGKPLVTRVGHSFIKEKMRATKAIFAGELSGHYYYGSNSYADSGDITLVLMLGLVSSSRKRLSALVAPLRSYSSSGEINFTVKDKESVLQRLRERYSTGTLSELDGITIEFDDWWFNVRASNTEPLLRLNVEATGKKLLDAKVKEVSDAIQN